MSSNSTNEVLETSEEDTLKYKEILRANGITDEVSEVIVKSAGLQGEGFASQTKYVTINFENSDIKPLHLFVKILTSNASHQEFLSETKLFEKESRFFMEYVPAAKQFCKSKGCEGLVDMYPTCFYGDNDMVVLENLVVGKGYVLLNKHEMQDLEASKAAVTTLAKHHAISYAFIEEMGGPKPFFKRFPSLDFEMYDQPTARAMIAPMLDNNIRSNLKMLENNNAASDKDEVINFLSSYNGKTYDDILNIVKVSSEEDQFRCLCNGDYWNNNMMFLKDEETDKFIGHMAIDLQVTRYNSPRLDIGQYLFTSVKPEVRKAHFHEILRHYFDTLKSTASKLGYPIDLTYEEMHKTIQKTIRPGFWFGMCVGVGAGFEAFQNINMNELGDIKNLAIAMDEAVQKWIDDNPEKPKESVQAIMDIVNEYKSLTTE